MVDMEILLSAADGAPVPVALKHTATRLLPSPQGILVPRPDGDLEPFTVDDGPVPHGKRALAAEPAETVPAGIIPAERRF
ncbi:hypothetical protein DSECCO2_479570 [anaerobic digester metagenome]